MGLAQSRPLSKINLTPNFLYAQDKHCGFFSPMRHTMAKRTVFEANPKAAHTGRHSKRQRTENSYERESPATGAGAAAENEVTSARQLQKELVFDQGSASSFRGGQFAGML